MSLIMCKIFIGTFHKVSIDMIPDLAIIDYNVDALSVIHIYIIIIYILTIIFSYGSVADPEGVQGVRSNPTPPPPPFLNIL